MDPVDLRSDTVTHPTEEMYRQMAIAPLGDDVFGDDPTVNRLEQVSAARLGKEAAMLAGLDARMGRVDVDSGAHIRCQGSGAGILKGFAPKVRGPEGISDQRWS